MEQEIRDIIAKNMPAEVGDVLKRQLLQAETDAAKVIDLTREIGDYRETNKNLTKENQVLRTRATAVSTRENEVTIREAGVLDVKHRLEMASLQLECERERRQDCFTMVGLIMGNNKYKYSRNESGMIPINNPGTNGACGYTGQESFNKHTDEEGES